MSPRKRIINEDTIIYQDEDVSEYETEDTQDIDVQEEVPEAFIPSFTVAPEEVPTPLPTPEEQQNAFEKLMGNMGKQVKGIASGETPTYPLDEKRSQFVTSTADWTAKVIAEVMLWVFSASGLEYAVLAPSEEEARLIVEPLWRIVARHSKMINQISPDYNDAILSLTALSGYAHVSMQLLRQIREEKAQNNGQIVTPKIRPNIESLRSNDIRRHETPTNQPDENSGNSHAESTGNLTDDERYAYEKLRTLSQRDYEYRARRAGRL